MRFIYPIVMIVLSSIITLTALKYSLKYMSIATDYILYKHVGAGTSYVITDYNINLLSDCKVVVSFEDKYYRPTDTVANNNIKVCYRINDMTLYWTTTVNHKFADLQMKFQYGIGILELMKFKNK